MKAWMVFRIIAPLGVAVLLAGCASAPEQAALAECAGEGPARARVAACTTIAESPRFGADYRAVALANRGGARIALGEDQSALADLDAAIAARPGLAEAYVFRGLVYALQGDQARAAQEVDVAGHMVVMNEYRREFRGDVLRRTGQLDREVMPDPFLYDLDFRRVSAPADRGMALRRFNRAIDKAEALGRARMAGQPSDGSRVEGGRVASFVADARAVR